MSKRLLLVLCACTGCDLYWGGGGGDDICAYGAAGQAQQLRNPNTGQCLDGGGGGGCCGDTCWGTGEDTPAGGADVDWAVCYGTCEGLGESACIAQAGCRAAYLDNSLADQTAPAFFQCWEVAPSGPIEGGNCANLDAQACSEHDDCSAVYAGANSPQSFEQCVAEGAACDLACPSGSHCEQQCPCDALVGCDTCNPMCVPDLTCASVDCGPGYQCVEQCDALVGGCEPTCVPVACEQLPGETACIERGDCVAIYTGSSCTCDANGCTCTMFTYSHCESGKL